MGEAACSGCSFVERSAFLVGALFARRRVTTQVSSAPRAMLRDRAEFLCTRAHTSPVRMGRATPVTTNPGRRTRAADYVPWRTDIGLETA